MAKFLKSTPQFASLKEENYSLLFTVDEKDIKNNKELQDFTPEIIFEFRLIFSNIRSYAKNVVINHYGEKSNFNLHNFNSRVIKFFETQNQASLIKYTSNIGCLVGCYGAFYSCMNFCIFPMDHLCTFRCDQNLISCIRGCPAND